MKNENIKIKWIGVKTPKNPSNKSIVWGIFDYELQNSNYQYNSLSHRNKKSIAFWSPISGKISFKSQELRITNSIIIKKQILKEFKQIDIKLFTELLWKNFEEDFLSSFIAFKLSGFE